jgi:hypothetical protein
MTIPIHISCVVIEYALKCSQERVQAITDFYKQEKRPTPVGFNDDDVNAMRPLYIPMSMH